MLWVRIESVKLNIVACNGEKYGKIEEEKEKKKKSQIHSG